MTAPVEPQLAEETPVWSGSPSQWLNFGTFTLCALAAGGFIAGASIWAEPRIAFLAAIPAIAAFWSWITVKTSKFSVTTQRITSQVGVFSRRRWDMELYRVKDTTLSEPFLLRLVSLANIEVVSSDKSTPNMMIPAVKDAEDLRQQIRINVEHMRMARRVRELDFET
jgi:membrane protein YdbS with pleckstrin-like domain